ncbi:class IV adenylate cyclase [bacterium]|nr:class IV adenylate cyclase [bacterium]
MEKRGFEIEAKFRLKLGQREAIAQALAGCPHARVEQEDRYFDAGPGRVLRLRQEEGAWLITRKEAPTVSADGTKTRTEIETPIPDELVEPLAETFAWLGHRPLIVVKKVRDAYEIDGATVCLDRIEGLDDDFAELEVLAQDAGDKHALDALRARFGLDEGQILLHSYARLLAEARGQA